MDCRKFKWRIVRGLPRLLLAIVLTTGSVQAQEYPFQNASLAPGMTNAQGEEIVGQANGFSAVLTLDDSNLSTLIQQGRVEIAIPGQLINSVESVVLKRPVHFKDDRATDFADAALSGQKLVVRVDRSVIERIDYQPVELKVYETGFRSVILHFSGEMSEGKLKAIGDPRTDSPLLTLKLKSGNGITGRISGMKQLKIDSSLGKIDVAFDRVSRVRVRPNGELGIEMRNGDLISGRVDGDKIELINRWSTETIELAKVSELIIKQPGKQAGQYAEQLRASAFPPSGISAGQSIPSRVYNATGF